MRRTQDRTGSRPPPETIRFTTVRAVDGLVEFEGIGHAGAARRFTIDGDTLRAIGGGDPKVELLGVYERARPLIHAVATRTFNAGVRGDPIHLPQALFRSL